MTQYTLNGFTITTGETEITIDSVVTINYFVSNNYSVSPVSLFFPDGLRDFWQLLYVDSGEVILSDQDASTTLNRGQVILRSPSNRLPDIKTSGSTNLVSISFTSDSGLLDAFCNRPLSLKEKERRLISAFVQEAETAFESKLENPYTKGLTLSSTIQPGAWQVLRSSIELLLLYLYRSATSNEVTEPRRTVSARERSEYLRMAEIISFLEENVTKKLTLDEVCQAAFMSRSSLQKLFKQRTGESVIEYFIALKTEEAKRLLAEGRYSISAISEMLGYNSIHYFSRQFKQETGISPSEYTRSLGTDEDESEITA